MFINGAPYSGSAEPFVGEVDRVEVLMGPQSVYFGRSTFSGAVNYVTKDPADHFSGRATADYYSYDGFDGTLSASGPIVADKLSARIDVRRYHFGGQYLNGVNTSDHLGEQGTTQATASIVATPTDKLKVHFYYSFDSDNDGAPPAAAIKVAGPGPNETCQLGGTGGAYWCGAIPNLKAIPAASISVQDTIDNFMRTELFGNARNYPVPFPVSWLDHFGLKRISHNANMRIDYETDGGWDISSITSFDHTKQEQLNDQQERDVSFMPNPLYPATAAALATACAAGQQVCYSEPFERYFLMQQVLQTDASTELRLSSPQHERLRATAGGDLYTDLTPGGANYGNQQSGRSTQAQSKTWVETSAIFGGVYYDLTQQLTLNAEARYQWDHIVQQQLYPTLGTRFASTFPSFSPRVTINYTFTQDQMVYAEWSRGYKPGGFNTALQGLSASLLQQLTSIGTNLTYEQERIDNFEIGHKATWLDNHLRTIVDVYYMPWRGGQISNSLSVINAQGTNQAIAVTQNAGASNLKGLEAQANASVTQRFTVNGTFDLESAKYSAYILSGDGPKIRNSTFVTGNQLEQIPKWSWSISPQYKAPLAGDWDWYSSLDYRYQSKKYIDATDEAWIPSRNLVDIHAGVQDAKRGVHLDVYVKNLFNNLTMNDAIRGNDLVYSPSQACPPCYTAANPPGTAGGAVLNEIRLGLPTKRTFGIKGTYDF